jgi:integrase/recombinase XerD
MNKANWNLTQDKIITKKQLNKLLKEMRAAMSAAILVKKDYKTINPFFIVSIAANTGLRIAELSELTWDAINLEEQYLIVKNGKGGKSRTVHFGDSTTEIFKDFRKKQRECFNRDCVGSEWIFKGQRGRLGVGGIHKIFKEWIRRVGLPAHLSMHSVRHYYATMLLQSGVDIYTTSRALGHGNITITSVYLHLTSEGISKLRKVV